MGRITLIEIHELVMIFCGTGVWQKAWQPSHKMQPRAFCVKRHWCITCKRIYWCCNASVHMEAAHCWEMSVGWAGLWNVKFCGTSACPVLFWVFLLSVFFYVTNGAALVVCVILCFVPVLSCSCSGLDVSTCQVIGWKDPSDAGGLRRLSRQRWCWRVCHLYRL